MRLYSKLAIGALGLALVSGAFLAPAIAQQAAPPAATDGGPATPPGMPPGHGMQPGMHPGMMGHGPWASGRPGWAHRRHGMPGAMFGLFFHQSDKQLTGPEVQKIAEAFLLWQGNRTWKVIDVKQTDDQVTFAFATPNGDPIASFSMDRRTGRLHRIG